MIIQRFRDSSAPWLWACIGAEQLRATLPTAMIALPHVEIQCPGVREMRVFPIRPLSTV